MSDESRPPSLEENRANALDALIAELRVEGPRLVGLYGRRTTTREIAVALGHPLDVVQFLWKHALAERREEIDSLFEIAETVQ